MERRIEKRRGENGQAAIEFVVVMLVIFFFLLFYLSICILLTTSEYIDYATFMAARTYKSSYGSENSQESYARLIFDSYAQKVQGIARNFNVEFSKTDPQSQQTGGVSASYDIDMFYLPPIFITGNAPPSKIRLTAEAHLGREPSFQECLDFFSNFAKKLNIQGMDNFTDEMDDNGC